MTVDYMECFKRFKKALNDSQKLAFPDFDKRWVLRADASLNGVGGVLLQEEEIYTQRALNSILVLLGFRVSLVSGLLGFCRSGFRVSLVSGLLGFITNTSYEWCSKIMKSTEFSIFRAQ